MTLDVSSASAHDPTRSCPAMAANENRVEPCPSRIRGVLNGKAVFDTTRAPYVWEWPGYPQLYVPTPDVRPRFFVASGPRGRDPWLARCRTIYRGVTSVGSSRPGSIREPADRGPAGTVPFDWDALDTWFDSKVAWTYDFPTRELTPIAGLAAFFNEDVDLFLDGQPPSRDSAPATSRRTR